MNHTNPSHLNFLPLIIPTSFFSILFSASPGISITFKRGKREFPHARLFFSSRIPHQQLLILFQLSPN